MSPQDVPTAAQAELLWRIDKRSGSPNLRGMVGSEATWAALIRRGWVVFRPDEICVDGHPFRFGAPWLSAEGQDALQRFTAGVRQAAERWLDLCEGGQP